MKNATLNDTTYALRLERGDDIHTVIEAFCAKHDIANAAVSGIGSVEDPKLAHYSIETRQFTGYNFTGIFEIASLLGNVALIGNQPKAHLHVTISDAQMRAHAGHLIQGACSATLEIILTAYPSHHHKLPDDVTGLTVWDF